jgi:ATP-dependent DNA helicase RecG
LHHPRRRCRSPTLEDHSHPAWQRLKAEELLAQQLSQLQARVNATTAAPSLAARAGRLHARLLAALPFRTDAAQQRVGEEIAHDLARPGADAPPAAG